MMERDVIDFEKGIPIKSEKRKKKSPVIVDLISPPKEKKN
jgi:hypothetical protein